MARPIKQGLDYFPLDVGFLRDLKVRRIIKACGLPSISILLCLLSNIYKDKGYYLQWDSDQAFLVADDIGTSEDAVMEVVKKALQVGFFDKRMWEEYQILTSKGIQSRYFFIAGRNQKKSISYDARFALISVNTRGNSINTRVNPVNTRGNPQSKANESKVNESKEKESPPASQVSDALANAFIRLTGGTNLMQMQKLSELADQYTERWVLDAIRITGERGIRKLSYAKGILEDWAANGREGPKLETRKTQTRIATADEWKGVTGW